MSRSISAAPLLTCADCDEAFPWDSSPDLDRCQRCAEIHDWRNGALLITALITGGPRMGKGGRGLVLVAPVDLIVSAPAGREQKER